MAEPATIPNPFTPAVVEDPYSVHAALREAGVAQIPGTDIFAVARAADVEYVLMHPELFSNIVALDPRTVPPDVYAKARLTGALPGSDPPEHNQYRILVGRHFSAQGVRPLEDRIRAIVDGLIDPWIDDGTVELASQFATPLTVEVFVELLGIKDEDVPRVKRWVDYTIENMSASVGMLTPERAQYVARQVAEFSDWLLALAHDRRAHPRDDLLTHVVTTPMPGLGNRPLLDQEIRGMLMTLLMGGTETTLNMICSGMWLLLTHPDQYAEVLADFTLIPNFVEEALRFESPVQGLFRRALADAEVGGVTIPAGSRVWVMYGSANRDPRQWQDPDRFDIHRPDAKEHVAFGAGVHYCLGAPLARMEGRIAFEQLFTRLKDIRFAEGRNDFRHGPSHVIRGFRELWLAFEKR
jgi:cytochrome P450